MANTEGEGVEDGSTEVEVEVVEVGLGAALPVVVGVVEGVREGIGGLEAEVTVEEEGELVNEWVGVGLCQQWGGGQRGAVSGKSCGGPRGPRRRSGFD